MYRMHDGAIRIANADNKCVDGGKMVCAAGVGNSCSGGIVGRIYDTNRFC
jgi:hypothetical protein